MNRARGKGPQSSSGIRLIGYNRRRNNEKGATNLIGVAPEPTDGWRKYIDVEGSYNRPDYVGITSIWREGERALLRRVFVR